MKTCKCGFTGDDSLFAKDRFTCLKCRRAQKLKSYYLNEHRRALSKSSKRTGRIKSAWGNSKSRDFLLDYNKNFQGTTPNDRIGHAKFVGNIIKITMKQGNKTIQF